MDTTYEIQKLSGLEPDAAEPPAKKILDQTQDAMGMIPNMYKTMANLPALFEAYAAGYQLFREDGGFSPVEQEVVFLTVSRENGCDYCMAAHSFLADEMSGVPKEVTDAIRAGATVPDPKLNALSQFTRTMVLSRGRPEAGEVDAFLAAGFTEKHILRIILAIAVKTLSNYSNHLFRTQVDEAFAHRAW